VMDMLIFVVYGVRKQVYDLNLMAEGFEEVKRIVKMLFLKLMYMDFTFYVFRFLCLFK